MIYPAVQQFHYKGDLCLFGSFNYTLQARRADVETLVIAGTVPVPGETDQVVRAVPGGQRLLFHDFALDAIVIIGFVQPLFDAGVTILGDDLKPGVANGRPLLGRGQVKSFVPDLHSGTD